MIRQASAQAAQALREFLKLESAGGLLLVGATVLALLLANIPPTYELYQWVLDLHLTVTLGGLGVDKPLLLWINDALMVLFFMLVGLELKREVVEGQLSRPEQVVLPALAAIGGLVVPALFYLAITSDAGSARNGWAIPTATDIAFALAVLGLMGSRVPVSLKVFLTTIAIVDDIAAIVIIALFYTSDLSTTALGLAGIGVVALFLLNRSGVMRLAPYLLVGAFIWFCVLKSGVHATLAGVVVAAFIPLRADDSRSPARHLEHALHPWVAFAVLPVFALANAGVSLLGLEAEDLTGPVPVGIVLGLFAGKQIGVLGMVGLACLLRIARLPDGVSWGQVFGVSALCGVGFTMSLFIGTLAFEHGDFDLLSGVKVGVICGSVLSAIWGIAILHFTLPAAAESAEGNTEAESVDR
ncbi:Na+/H+ antiporter NhaA [Elongatibacter sediminis]|uniref:Na(+)/H(+) antiporter NhaA n=1 Tax=Elongatibacter sediminis TaxID=3119006 RepID=A0AAW9RFS2_9GAMM